MLQRHFIIIVVSLFLQGCIAGAFVAGSTAGGSIAGDKRSLPTMVEDEGINFRATQRLSLDHTLKEEAHIGVTTFNHVVLLTGQAPTAELRDKAGKIAQNDPEIKKVYNQITIGSPTSALTRSNDILITSNIKTRMLTTTNLKSSQFKVTTENGTAYIMGLSNHTQADIAATVAQNSTGVKKVVKVIEYTI